MLSKNVAVVPKGFVICKIGLIPLISICIICPLAGLSLILHTKAASHEWLEDGG